jgi:hypothetical protein
MTRKKTSGGISLKNIPKMIPTQNMVQAANKFATIGNTRNLVQAAQNLQPTQNLVQAAQKLVPKTNWRSQAAILAEKTLGDHGSAYYRKMVKTADVDNFYGPSYYKKEAEWAEGVERAAARKARKERGMLAYVDDAKKAKKDLNTYLEDSKKGINTYLGSKDFDRKRVTLVDSNGTENPQGDWAKVDQQAKYNPLYQATKALEDATYVEGYVKYINIIYAFSVLLKWISMITYNVISFVTRVIFALIWNILSILIIWFPYIFIAAVVLFCCEYVWIGLVIVINGLIDGWNGAIGVWNTIVARLSDLSIHVPIYFETDIGDFDLSFTIPIPGIPLPKGNTESHIEKDYWQTLHEIVDVAIINPVKKSLKGIIYR